MAGFTRIADAPNFDSQGWCQTTKMTNHRLLMSWVENLEVSSLNHILTDCRNAVEAMPDNPKAGHYTDTAHYIGMRLTRLTK